jgi:hypothetical protein
VTSDDIDCCNHSSSLVMGSAPYTQGRSSHLPIPTLRFSCHDLGPLLMCSPDQTIDTRLLGLGQRTVRRGGCGGRQSCSKARVCCPYCRRLGWRWWTRRGGAASTRRKERRGRRQGSRGRAWQIMLATSCDHLQPKKRGSTMWMMMWQEVSVRPGAAGEAGRRPGDA